MQVAGCRVQGAGCRAQSAGYRVQGLPHLTSIAPVVEIVQGVSIQGVGFRVLSFLRDVVVPRRARI